MSSPNTISGKYLTVTVNGVVIAGLQAWDVDEDIAQLDGTTGADQGFENDDGGVYSAEIRLELVQNLLTGMYIEIANGTLLAELKLYRSSSDNQPAFYFPFARVYKSSNGGKVRERFTSRHTARSNGPYTRNNPGAG